MYVYGGSGTYIRMNGGTGMLGYNSGNSEVFQYVGDGSAMWMGPYKSQIVQTVQGGITEIISQDIIESNYVAAASVQGTIISNAVSGEALTFGMLVYLASNNKWIKADADSSTTSTRLLGIVLTTVGGADSKISVLLEGQYSTDVYHDQVASPASPGAPLYISTNAGYVTQTAPTGTGKVVRLIGHNLYGASGRSNVAIVRFKPDATWIQL
jgi:hypothetical protein